MKFNQQLDCPVTFIPINENKVRVVALFIFILSVTYIALPHWSVEALLTIDFFFRSFGFPKLSYLGWVGDRIVKSFSIPNKPIDSGPKKFAATVGFVISISLLVSTILKIDLLQYGLAGTLILFSFLESVFNFCAGCHVYILYKKIFLSPSAN